jgi:hypothetical protein
VVRDSFDSNSTYRLVDRLPSEVRFVEIPQDECKSSLSMPGGDWFASKNISASALILHFRRVRLTLDDLFYVERRTFYAQSDC